VTATNMLAQGDTRRPVALQIEQVELTEIRMPLNFRFETSFGATQERRILLLRLRTDQGEGVAECVAPESAGYCEETIDTAWAVLPTLILPAVLGKRFANATALVGALAPIRGHRMAKAALECAFWEAFARARNLPLWQVLGGVYSQVPVGISLGLQPSTEALLSQVEAAVAQGYRRIKLKIKPGHDLAIVAAVRACFPEIVLSVDANSAYRLSDITTLQKLDEYDLAYIEQPLAHDDLHDHALLQARLATPICLDESIGSPADARKALATQAAHVINIKLGRVGGLLRARQVHDVAEAFSAPVWCGGRLESGVGRAFNLALASLPNFTMPGDTASASRYWRRDIVHEALEAKDGLMDVPQGPGSGVTVDWEYVDTLTARKECYQAGE
jgi:O-succinylbenzoate synthase